MPASARTSRPNSGHQHHSRKSVRHARIYPGHQSHNNQREPLWDGPLERTDPPTGSSFQSASILGIPGININGQSGGLPAFTITGFQALGDNSTYPENSQITTFQLDSSLSLIRGAHTIKFGGLFLRHRFNGFSAFPTRGTYDFNGQFTRQVNTTSSQTALADFALGVPDAVNRNVLVGGFGMRRWTFAPYFQDSWRITSRLTAELGVRWEIDAPPYDVHDHWSNLNVQTGMLMVAGMNGNSRRLRNFDLNTIGPRVGLTYALTSDRKTVLRSGFGISYVNMDAGGAQLYKNPPYFFNQVISTNINGVPPLTLSSGLPAPVPPGHQQSRCPFDRQLQRLGPEPPADGSTPVELWRTARTPLRPDA